MQRKVSPDAGMDRSGSFEDDSIRRLRRDEGEAAMDMEFRSLSFVVLQRRILPELSFRCWFLCFKALRQLGMLMTDPTYIGPCCDSGMGRAAWTNRTLGISSYDSISTIWSAAALTREKWDLLAMLEWDSSRVWTNKLSALWQGPERRAGIGPCVAQIGS